MSSSARVRCPQCGEEMNFHAEKLDPSRGVEDPGADEALGGVLLEIHTCPACKFVLGREAR